MTDEELLKWSDRVRAMFRGEMDEMLFTLARSRIKALSFNSAEAQPDPVVSLLSDHRELLIFGEITPKQVLTAA